MKARKVKTMKARSRTEEWQMRLRVIGQYHIVFIIMMQICVIMKQT